MPQPRLKVNDPEGKVPAAWALEVVGDLIKSKKGRQDYKAKPKDSFDKKKVTLPPPLDTADYEAIPLASRLALQGLSEEQLELLSSLEKTFIDDGLYVEVPSPGKLFYK